MCDVLITTGEMFHDAIDLDIPGYPPFEFKRSYSTKSTEKGPLGWGWQHNWQISLEILEKGDKIRDMYFFGVGARTKRDGTIMHITKIMKGKFKGCFGAALPPQNTLFLWGGR